jgi:hypothetical protein
VAQVLRQVGAVSDADRERLAFAGRLATLEDVLRAGLDVVDVIVQDEYTHDVVTRRPGAAAYVCFDTT